MFRKIYLETANRNFAEIMSNDKQYRIPRFQRDYSWGEDQWDELWQDIEQMLESEIQHFMGYLVLQTKDSRNFQVIDGQQRLATISLIILAGLHLLKKSAAAGQDEEGNRKRIEYYHRAYIGALNRVTLTTSPKLSLNRRNERHFRGIIEGYDIQRKRNITETNRRINRAFEFFYEKLSPFREGKQIAALIDKMTDGLLFTAITVQDDQNAYILFETLNARGLHLSAPDMLKNYLLSVMAGNPQFGEDEFADFEERWEAVVTQLGGTRFTGFLRSHIGIAAALPPKKDLYRSLKKIIDSPEKVWPYLRELEERAPVYAALQNHNDPFWIEYGAGEYKGAQPHIEALSLFNIKTPLSLLMAGYRQFAPADFLSLLRWIVVISVRYNVVCSKPANRQESHYNQIANAIAKEELPLAEAKKRLLALYPEDEELKAAFKVKSMPSRQKSRQILFLLRSIERHLSGGEEPPLNLTLEHLLPYNPEDDWQEYFGRDDCDGARDRLGNMTILAKDSNMGQEPFRKKRAVLAESQYRINKNIAACEEWNMDSLQQRQMWLAKQATALWKA